MHAPSNMDSQPRLATSLHLHPNSIQHPLIPPVQPPHPAQSPLPLPSDHTAHPLPALLGRPPASQASIPKRLSYDIHAERSLRPLLRPACGFQDVPRGPETGGGTYLPPPARG